MNYNSLTPYDHLTPNFELEAQDTKIDLGVTKLISSIEYESVDGIADMIKISAKNPNFMVSKLKSFQPGNELNLRFGYGNSLDFIGRFVIVKSTPNYPQSDMPSMEIVGYSKDQVMMHNSPRKSKGEKGKHGRIFKEVKYSDVVEAVAKTYKFETDIDDTEDGEKNIIQKVGLTDYQFVAGLSNITGYTFWVDGNENGIWTLHFKNPKKPIYQNKKYTFQYNVGDASSLLSFNPSVLIQDGVTELQVSVKDFKSGKIIDINVEENNNKSPDIDATDDVTGEINTNYTTASDVQIYIKDYSFNLVANKRFTNSKDIEKWAKQWFRRNRENFIMGDGSVIGIENLKAMQIHRIEGIGNHLDGDYYFSKVRHIFNDNGYICEFSARKVVPEN